MISISDNNVEKDMTGILFQFGFNPQGKPFNNGKKLALSGKTVHQDTDSLSESEKDRLIAIENKKLSKKRNRKRKTKKDQTNDKSKSNENGLKKNSNFGTIVNEKIIESNPNPKKEKNENNYEDINKSISTDKHVNSKDDSIPQKEKSLTNIKEIKNITSNFCIYKNNLLQIRLSQQNLSKKSLKEKLSECSEVIDSIQNRPSQIKCIIELQENNLNDKCIIILCDFIINHNLNVTILKLWKNDFGDNAAIAISKLLLKIPIHEVHLSHNKITSIGMKAIIDSVYNNKLFPIQIENSQTSNKNNHDILIVPLWLRLEYNRIDPKESIGYMKKLGIHLCDADNRNKCGPTQCSKKKKIPLIHLYCFLNQIQDPKDSPSLIEAKEIAIQLKKQIVPSNSNIESQNLRINNRLLTTDPNTISNQLPLYVFVDTCSIINMLDSNKKLKEVNSSNLFNFKNLIRKSKDNKFGTYPDKKDNIYLIITDTVMQELDRKKNENSFGHLSKLIREFTKDDGTIHKAIKENFLIILGVHQAENLIKSKGKEFFRQGDEQISNDSKLLQVALFWQVEIGIVGSVLVLTDDNDMYRRSKQYNIPSEKLSQLDENLNGSENEIWNAQFLREKIPNAFINFSKEDMRQLKPININSNSIYTELEEAINLVQIWLQKEKQSSQEENNALSNNNISTTTTESTNNFLKSQNHFVKNNRNEDKILIQQSENAIQRWRELLQNVPSLLK